MFLRNYIDEVKASDPKMSQVLLQSSCWLRTILSPTFIMIQK